MPKDSGVPCPVTGKADRTLSHGVKTGQEVPTDETELDRWRRNGAFIDKPDPANVPIVIADEYDEDIADQLHIEITDGFITDDYYDG